MIVFKCPNGQCPQTISIKEEYAGTSTKCPRCRTPFVVPAPTANGAGTAAPARPAAPAQPQFYFAQGGQRFGPVSWQQLQECAAARQLGSEDLVWREGWPQWAAAKAVPDLFPAPPVAPAAPPPTPPPPTAPTSAVSRIDPGRDRVAVRAEPSAEAATPTAASFGMSRLVYWSMLIGGWSALLGWAVAELLIGRWVGQYFLLAVLMIVFVASAIGAGLSQVEALSTSQWKGQLKQLPPGLLGGFAGGLFGGLLGNLFYLLLGGQVAWLGFLGRLLGWTLLGTSIGISDGLLRRHWRRFRNGLIGGTIGGFLGGLFFNPVNYLIGSPVSSRAFAFVLLGLCIGLFVGLVQVLLKEAWVTVQAGFRPGRQLILNETVTTMGTSEKGSLIFIAYGARGVEPVHLRIRRTDDGSYFLEDNNSRSGTFLNGEMIDRPRQLAHGDVIRFGVNEVCFHERYRPRQESARPAGGGHAE